MNSNQDFQAIGDEPAGGLAPHQFIDGAGRVWSLVITIGDAKRLKSQLNWDIMGVINNNSKALKQIAEDPFLMCDIVWALIESKATSGSVTSDEFLNALGGMNSMGESVIDGMTSAFQQALINFFPSGQRRFLGVALRKSTTVEAVKLQRLESIIEGEKMTSLLMKDLDSMEAKVLQSVDAEIAARNAGSSSTKPPAS